MIITKVPFWTLRNFYRVKQNINVVLSATALSGDEN